MVIEDSALVNWFTEFRDAQLGAEGEQEVMARVTIQSSALEFARTILAFTPASADQTAAIRKVREAVWTAIAAIECGGK